MSLLVLFQGAKTKASAPVTPVTLAPGVGALGEFATGQFDFVHNVGWIPEQRRRISVEALREILKAQGSPWAAQLADVAQRAEKRIASSVVSQRRHKKLTKELDKIFRPRPPTFNWAPIIAELLRLLQEDDDDEEEAILLLWMKSN